jgi:hypothetical protein
MQEPPESVLEQFPERNPDANPGDSPARIAEQASGRKFWVAMAVYGILAALIWFTVGEGTVRAFGRPVEIRWIPLLVIGTFAFRTYVAREADKIRRQTGGPERTLGSWQDKF